MPKSVRLVVSAVLSALVLPFVVGVGGPVSAAPVSAAPDAASGADLSDPAVQARLIAPFLPRPGSNAAARTGTFALRSKQPSPNNLVITCTGSTKLLQTPAGISPMTVGTSSSSCPVPVDFVSAQVTIFEWIPDFGEWMRVSYGTLAYQQPYLTAGVSVNSVTTTSCSTRTFIAGGFHQARRGTAYATGVSSSAQLNITFCGI